MTNTLEQRKEIAEKLRAKYRERMKPGQFVAQDWGLEAIGYLEDLEECLPDGESAFTVIADLIDPVCTPVVDDVYGMPDELVCSECGCCLAITVDGKPSAPLSRYCPCCGARIVEVE